jgi:hypothetical protein
VAETVEAGGVRIKFEGTADQLLAEIKKLSGSIGEVGKASQAAGAAVSNSGGAMAKAFAAAQSRLAAINQAAQSVAGVLGGLNTVEGEVANGAVKIIGALASGGPIDAGIAALGVGVTHLAKEWVTAKQVAEAALAAMVSGGAEVASTLAGLRDQQAGLSSGQVKAQQEVDFQLARQGDAMARLAEFDGKRLERLRESIDANRDIYSDLARQLDAYDAINTELSGINSDLSNAKSELDEIGERQKKIKDDAEAEARAREASAKALDREYATLLRKLDTEKNRASVDAELSSGGRVDTEWNANVDDIIEQAARLADWEKEMNDRAAKKSATEQAALEEQRRHLDDLKKINEEEHQARREANAALAASLTSAIVSGNGGQALGSMAGGVVGAAVAPLVGADPLTGGAIGEVLGGLFGGLIDELEPLKETLATTMDAFGILASTLNPFFSGWVKEAQVLKDVFQTLVPLFDALIEPGTAWIDLLVQLAEAAIPIIGAWVGLLLILNKWFPLLKGITIIFEGIAAALDELDTAIADLINGLHIVGMQDVKPASSAGGTTAADINEENRRKDEENAQNLSDFLAGYDANTDATKDNTSATRAAAEALSNMPKFWKIAQARAQAADVEAPPSSSPGASGTGTVEGGGSGGRRTVIMIGGKVLADVLEEADRFSGVKRHGVANNGGSSPRGDD